MMMMMLMMMIMLMAYEWKASVWIGVFKKATQRPSRTGAALVSTITSVCLSLSLFYTYKFPLHDFFMFFVAKKQNRTPFFKS